jgi:hypothetical protein
MEETGKVHDLFCKRIMGGPTAAANGACEGIGKDKQEGKGVRKSI